MSENISCPDFTRYHHAVKGPNLCHIEQLTSNHYIVIFYALIESVYYFIFYYVNESADLITILFIGL